MSLFGRRSLLRGILNRSFLILARYAPGAESFRVWLHRCRGVTIGDNCFISTDALIETSRPYLVRIGNGVDIGVRSTILAHYRGQIKADRKEYAADDYSVTIEDDVVIGAGALILPNVTIGHGSVVTAGSVVTRSVPPMTMVSGNPAKPVAKCGVPLGRRTPVFEFFKNLKPLSSARKPRSST